MDTRSSYEAFYHDLLRPEIAALIPATACKILDLGCGSGRLGEFIKQRQACTYHGIEINPAAANFAKRRLDRVYSYDLELHPSTNKGLGYDTLVLADILEHVKDPEDVLRHFLNEMHESGTVVASIPNVAHPSVMQELKRGLFRYTNAGILDNTHLRFFTLTTIFQLFTKLDLKITQVIPSPSVHSPIQWLITAKRAPTYGNKITTNIIIPTYNMLQHLQSTITSIRQSTVPSYRIIVVNNNSDKETTDWVAAQRDVLEIRCTQNLGFTIATNLGMAISSTPYTVLLNNDVVVTQGWLNKLIICAESDKRIGIVGPITNKVSGKQLIQPDKYSSNAELEKFSAKVTTTNINKDIYNNRIVFFCTLIKKEVIDKIGILDERFAPGNFEDDDFCLRSLAAGYKNIINTATYVHHFGSQSFGGNKDAYNTLLKRNRGYFFAKWGNRADKFFSLSS